jgi:hypothetical protein
MAGLIPGPMEARASWIPVQQEDISETDRESMEALRQMLENKLIAEKLLELGLSSEEIIHRVEQLSPEERQIVLEELKAVQSGGQFWEFIAFSGQIILVGYLLLIGLALWLLVTIIKGVSGTPGGKERASRGLTFVRGDVSDYPPNDGKVKVIMDEEPDENLIYIGEVHITDFVIGADKEKREPRLLNRMKVKAAEHGADTIILLSDELRLNPHRYLYWSARAFRTR